jgi:hypothetical protein
MDWEPKCKGAHDWTMSGGSAPRDFCYVCKRCGTNGWFRHFFDNNECRTYLNFWRFPFLKRFGVWTRGPDDVLPGMKRENY